MVEVAQMRLLGETNLIEYKVKPSATADGSDRSEEGFAVAVD